MKILMVNDYKYKIAGTEIYMLSIMENLQKKGHEVKLFSSEITPDEYFSPFYNKSYIKYIQRIFNITYYLKFKKLVNEYKPDIIHIHNIYNEITPSILFNIKHTAIVMTVHGSQMISPVSIQTERSGKTCREEICEGCVNCVGWKGYLYEIIKRSVYKKLLKHIFLYITPSKYLKKVLEHKKYRQVVCLYNGIHLLKYAKIKYTKNLLYVGRLTKEKGLEVLLYAINNLVQKIPQIRLTIVGEGNYMENIKTMIKILHIEKNVLLVGSVLSNSLETYYAAATVVMLPSIYPDNLPTVGLEALSVGRPIIGSNIGGISEIVKNNETGIVVEAGNHEKIADAVIEIIKNEKKIYQMSICARKYAEKNFDIRNHIIELENIYRRVIKNSDRRRKTI